MLSNQQADYSVRVPLPVAPLNGAVATEVARDEDSLLLTQTPSGEGIAVADLPGPAATPSPTPTATPVPPLTTTTPLPSPSATPVPPTATPVPPDTVTPVPPDTVTPVPPDTVTPVPPDTVTPVPPATVTPVPPDTATPVPPDTVTPVPSDTATPPNESPLVSGDTVTMNEDDPPFTIDVLANDLDPDGTLVPGTLVVLVGPARGTAVVVTGRIVYTPDLNFNGQDTFVYQVCDDAGACATGTVVVNVNPQDDPPVAVADTYSVLLNQTLNMTTPGLLVNDINVDPGDTIVAELVNSPATGTLPSFNPDGSFTYQPLAAFTGTDTFTYRACDQGSILCSDPATVTISVTFFNNPPVAQDDSAFTIAGTSEVIAVLSNDTDPDGDPLTITIVTPPSNGSVSNNGTSITYTPDSGFSGVDTFSYTIDDGNGGTATATVTVTVVPISGLSLSNSMFEAAR